MISDASNFWTSSLYRSDGAFIYYGDRGTYNWDSVRVGRRHKSIAITVYEF